jgi:hypothetical protein
MNFTKTNTSIANAAGICAGVFSVGCRGHFLKIFGDEKGITLPDCAGSHADSFAQCVVCGYPLRETRR